MYKLLRTVMYVCLFFVSSVASSKPLLLYTEYISLLTGPVVSNVSLFSEPTVDTQRLVNIVIHQSQILDENNIDLFMSNINVLLKRDDISEYKSIIIESKINALMISGRFKSVIKEVNSLDKKEGIYLLYKSIAYVELNQMVNAIKTLNSLPISYFKKDVNRTLDIASNMVVTLNVPSNEINLPGKGNFLLADKLFKIYFKYKLYKKAFDERVRMISWLPLDSSRNKKRIELIASANKYNLPFIEIEMMEDYLKKSSLYKIKISDLKYINKYTKLLIDYYYDERNVDLYKKINMNKLLEKQRLGSVNDKKTKINFLKNIVFIHKEKKDNVFYKNVILLAIMTKDKEMLSKVYNSKLSHKTKRSILNAYFTILIDDESDLYMTKELVSIIEGCVDNNYPPLFYALKGHAFAESFHYKEANICFKKVNLNEIPKIIAKDLLKEKFQVAYVEAKKSNDEMLMLSLSASSGDSKMQFDAVSYFIENSKLNSQSINKIHSFIEKSQLSRSEADDLYLIINDSLIEHNQKLLLASQYKKDPNKYYLELVWLAMESSNYNQAINYIFEVLVQGRKLSDYSRVKIIRYLDSYYRILSSDQLLKLSNIAIDNKEIKGVIDLNVIEDKLKGSFSYVDLSTLKSVAQGLKDYNSIKSTLNVRFSDDNQTSKLLLNARLDMKFSGFLISLLKTSSEKLKPLLLNKSSELKVNSYKALIECINMKVEGVQDIRIIQAIELKELLNDN